DAEHVRDLVGISDDRRCSEREHEPRELVDQKLDRLEVQVSVDEAGNDEPARGVEGLDALIRPETGDDAVDDGDVALEPLASEDREDPAAANDEIGALVSARDGDPSFETRHRGDDN